MRIKTTDLKDAALDWAANVARQFVPEVGINPYGHPVLLTGASYSSSWDAGGPLIEQLIQQGYRFEKADFNLVVKCVRVRGDTVEAAFGPTTLVAGVRAYAASVLGEYVDVPDELLRTAKVAA